MKLLIIFNKNIEISPEKVCIHVGHSNRDIMQSIMYDKNHFIYNKWSDNHFKNVLLKDKITENIIKKIKEVGMYNYEIYDAGLDGTFEVGTILGYAVLVPNADNSFKRLRTLIF